MPGPITSTQPQVTQGSCAGDLISALRDFKAGPCIDVRVPAGQTLILSAIGLGASVVTVERVLEGDCDTRYYLPMQTAANCPLVISTATPMQPIKVQGLYRLCITPPNVAALVKEELIQSDSAACCSITARCQPTGVELPPVTATVTGVPCPLVAPFVWQGTTYGAVGDFITAVQAQAVGAVYNPITCVFTAPAGTTFPALVLSLPLSTVVYCPTIALLDGGYGYHDADPRDPAATVEIAPCSGDLTTDPVYIYPTAAPGRTAKVLDCAGVAVGYGVNQSKCAPPCPCPATCGPTAASSPPPPPPPLQFIGTLSPACSNIDPRPSFRVYWTIAGLSATGDYVVRDAANVDITPTVPHITGTADAFDIGTSFLSISGTEPSLAGQTWSLVHVASGTVLSTAVVPFCPEP